MSYRLKKEFADARISVGKFKLDITKDNVSDEFTQEVIAETQSIQHMFEGEHWRDAIVDPDVQKAVSSLSTGVKNES